MTRLTARQVAVRMKIARSTLYRWMTLYGFPRPVRVGGRCEWVESEIVDWEASRVGERG